MGREFGLGVQIRRVKRRPVGLGVQNDALHRENLDWESRMTICGPVELDSQSKITYVTP